MDVVSAKQVVEGAGVRLRRVFGFYETSLTDPFLLLDHFGSQDPRDYLAGFPWHPHRGIETVTYMLSGLVEHGDSLGNLGVISAGGVQWMTAGSGIIHQEMPKPSDGMMEGFQLWVNLPRSRKMSEPVYRDVKSASIDAFDLSEGATMKIISGSYHDALGPVKSLNLPVDYFDLVLDSDTKANLHVKPGHNTVVYSYRGGVVVDGEAISSGDAALISSASEIEVYSAASPSAVLFISAQPLGEPVAWRGPIVMNTEEELDLAFEELAEGVFIKDSAELNVEGVNYYRR